MTDLEIYNQVNDRIKKAEQYCLEESAKLMLSDDAIFIGPYVDEDGEDY